MKKLALKSLDKIILVVLSLFGFLGCETPMEYGTPYADYEIKGTVTDSITSVPIQNVKVLVTHTRIFKETDTTFIHIDTLAFRETDGTGKYDIQFQSFPLDEDTIRLKVDDLDGVANGGDFSSQEKDVVFKYSDLKGKNGGWYDGKAVKSIDFKLKRK